MRETATDQVERIARYEALFDRAERLLCQLEDAPRDESNQAEDAPRSESNQAEDAPRSESNQAEDAPQSERWKCEPDTADAAPAWTELRALTGALEAYYTSEEWLRDYDADAAGQLPAGLKRGVLSQDGIDHLLERVRELRRTREGAKE